MEVELKTEKISITIGNYRVVFYSMETDEWCWWIEDDEGASTWLTMADTKEMLDMYLSSQSTGEES